jgi:Flp pilus assembly protein TadD
LNQNQAFVSKTKENCRRNVCPWVSVMLRLLQLRRVLVPIALSFCTGFVAAQSRTPPVTTAAGTIRGSVLLPSGSFLNESVKITLQSIRGIRSSVYTDNRGQFQFGGLAAGSYQIVVEADEKRFEVTTATVEVYPGGPAVLSITLKEKNDPAKLKKEGTTVSATELDPAIPAKARKEFDRASDAGRNGKPEEATAHLRKAIEIYPNYLMARNDLGVVLFSQGKLDEAAQELALAVALDPKAFNPHLNLGIVLVQQQKFGAAADSLRKALALEGNSPAARLYLGIALEGLNELDEAQRALTTAHDLGGPKFALALFHLGQIHMSKGEHEQARLVFEAYLREAPNATNAAEVRKLIGMLR